MPKAQHNFSCRAVSKASGDGLIHLLTHQQFAINCPHPNKTGSKQALKEQDWSNWNSQATVIGSTKGLPWAVLPLTLLPPFSELRLSTDTVKWTELHSNTFQSLSTQGEEWSASVQNKNNTRWSPHRPSPKMWFVSSVLTDYRFLQAQWPLCPGAVQTFLTTRPKSGSPVPLN